MFLVFLEATTPPPSTVGLVTYVLGALLVIALGALASVYSKSKDTGVNVEKIRMDAVEAARKSSLETLQAALSEQRSQTEFFKGQAEAYQQRLEAQEEKYETIIKGLEHRIDDLERKLEIERRRRNSPPKAGGRRKNDPPQENK